MKNHFFFFYKNHFVIPSPPLDMRNRDWKILSLSRIERGLSECKPKGDIDNLLANGESKYLCEQYFYILIVKRKIVIINR